MAAKLKSTKRAHARKAEAAAVEVAVAASVAVEVAVAAVDVVLVVRPAILVINRLRQSSTDGCGLPHPSCATHLGRSIVLMVCESGTTNRARRHHQNGAAEYDVPRHARQRARSPGPHLRQDAQALCAAHGRRSCAAGDVAVRPEQSAHNLSP